MNKYDYKEFSTKLRGYYEPAQPFHMYKETVIKELHNYPKIRHAKKADLLWKYDFESALHQLPRDKEQLMYFYYWDDGFNTVIITETYICGFEVIHTNTGEKEHIRLNYQNKNGEIVNSSYSDFSALCDEANYLVGNDLDLFVILQTAYSKIHEALLFYKEHININVKEINEHNMWQLMCDNEVIYEFDQLSGLYDGKDHWKI